VTPWWSALAPVALPVACGEQRHELRWAEGRLTAPGHPDAERERALAALGADPSPCLQVLDLWNRHADDLDVLALAGRGPGDPLQPPLRFAGHGHVHFPGAGYRALSQTGAYASMVSARPAAMGWTAYRPMGRRRYVDYDEEQLPEDDLPLLLSLGSGLPQRLTATVIATWAERVEVGDARVAAAAPALDAAVYGRLRATLLPWLGGPARIEFTLQPPGAEPALRYDDDVVAAALPFAWLREVWANGLPVILDRFCLRAEQTTGRTWSLTTVARDLAEPQLLTVTG
jgi:hypothetical protein